MFYSETILSSKGPLAKVWLAAHMEKKLTKAQLLHTDLNASIVAIRNDDQNKMALRLSGQLLLGVVRIYSKKAKYLLDDCNEANLKIKLAFRPGVVDLPAEQLMANFNSITLPDTITDVAVLIPNFDGGLSAWDEESKALERTSNKSTLSRLQDITMQDNTVQDGMVGGMVGFEPYIQTGEEPELNFDFDNGGMDIENMDFETGRLVEAGRRDEIQISPLVNQGDMNNMDSTPNSVDKSKAGVEESPNKLHTDFINNNSFHGIGFEYPTALLQQGIDLTVPYVEKKGGAQLKKRRLLFDSVTSLPTPTNDNEFDTSDITTNNNYNLLANSEESNPLHDVSLGLYFDTDGVPNFVDEIKTKFARFNLNTNQEFVPSVYGSENNFGDFGLGDPFDPLGDMSNNLYQGEDGFNHLEDALDFDNAVIPTQHSDLELDMGSTDSNLHLETTTLKVLQLVRQNLVQRSESNASAQPSTLDFNKLLVNQEGKPTNDKKAAVSTFYDLLVLKTKGYVDLHQSAPYQPIQVSQLNDEL